LDRGQVSVEAMIVSVIVCITFILVVMQVNWRSQQAGELELSRLQEKDCYRLASAITLAQSGGDSMEITIELHSDANISGNSITLANHYCYFAGRPLGEAQLEAGKVTVRVTPGSAGVYNG